MPADSALLLISGAMLAVGLGALYIARRTVSARASGEVEPGSPVAVDNDEVTQLLEVGILRFDRELRLVRANPAAAGLLNIHAGGVGGRTVMEIFLDHQVEDTARAAASSGSANLEISLPGRAERRVALRLWRAIDGGLWVVVNEVTELRRLQRIRTEFIDNLSHELRTPLTTIRLLTETLGQEMERTDVPPRIRERVAKIDVETGHLVQMVNELLDLSRIEGGAAELHFEDAEMDAIIAGSVARLRTFAERQGVELATGGDQAAVVWGDSERLGQVLVNLLHNAIKFSPSGTTVTISTRVADDQLVVEVRDQGEGIARADLDRVFERFYKADKARQRGQGGTGLGLSIARHVVEGHGGRLWVESEEGKGSTFTFSVPLATNGAR